MFVFVLLLEIKKAAGASVFINSKATVAVSWIRCWKSTMAVRATKSEMMVFRKRVMSKTAADEGDLNRCERGNDEKMLSQAKTNATTG